MLILVLILEKREKIVLVPLYLYLDGLLWWQRVWFLICWVMSLFQERVENLTVKNDNKQGKKIWQKAIVISYSFLNILICLFKKRIFNKKDIKRSGIILGIITYYYHLFVMFPWASLFFTIFSNWPLKKSLHRTYTILVCTILIYRSNSGKYFIQ